MIISKVVLAGLLIIAASEDLIRRRIPNYLIASGLIAFASEASWLLYRDQLALTGNLLAGGAAFILYVIPYIAGAMGAGDVKLAFIIGLILGWESWTRYMSVFCVLSTLVSIGALIYRKEKKRAIPLAPVMAVAYLTGLCYNGLENVLFH